MTDRLIVGQVDGCDLMGGKEDAVTPVSAERSDGEAFAAESLRNFPLPTFEADVSLGGRDSPDDLVVVVFGLRQPIRHGAEARTITAGRHLLAERFVGTVEIVDAAPAIESALGGGEIAEALEGEHLGFERAVEALVLAPALRMIGPAVDHTDAELEQPHAELGPRLLGRRTPRASIVDEHGLRQAVAAKRRLEMRSHGLALFVTAGRKAQREPRMIVDHGQRMARRAVAQPHVALEVHLPKQVWRLLLEPPIRLTRDARRGTDASMPTQDRVQRRDGRNGVPVAGPGSAQSCGPPKSGGRPAPPT